MFNISLYVVKLEEEDKVNEYEGRKLGNEL